jgi:hypothetical protein
MPRQLIPPDQWRTFCDRFSRQHRGWFITVAATDTQTLPAQSLTATHPLHEQLISDAPLRGITAEDTPLGPIITIIAGRDAQRITHRIQNPKEILFERSEQAAHVALRIDDHTGCSTLLRFRVPAEPETLDGELSSLLP